MFFYVNLSFFDFSQHNQSYIYAHAPKWQKTGSIDSIIHNWLKFITKATVNLVNLDITCQQSEYNETWLFHRSNCTYYFQKGYDELQYIVPTCQQTDQIGGTKLSKATVLQRCKHSLSLSTQCKPLVTCVLGHG